MPTIVLYALLLVVAVVVGDVIDAFVSTRGFARNLPGLATRDALPPALVALADSYDSPADENWCGFIVRGAVAGSQFARVALADASAVFDLRLTAAMKNGRITRMMYAAVSDFPSGRLETSNTSMIAGVGRRSVVQTVANGGIDDIVDAHRAVLRALADRGVEPFAHDAAAVGDRYLRRRADEVATTSTARGIATIVSSRWRRRLRRPQVRAPVTDPKILDRIAHLLGSTR